MQIILTEVFFETEANRPEIAKAILFIAKRVKYKYKTIISKEDIMLGYDVNNIVDVERINDIIGAMGIADINTLGYTDCTYEVFWHNGNTSAHIIFYEKYKKTIDYIKHNAEVLLTNP